MSILFHQAAQLTANAIEVLAVAIILIGVVSGTARFIFHLSGYEHYKETLDKALLLGLNVLVAADIVRTVALEPTMTNIAGLGLLVVVRTFVSWSLFVEMEDRWPWQPPESDAPRRQRPH